MQKKEKFSFSLLVAHTALLIFVLMEYCSRRRFKI